MEFTGRAQLIVKRTPVNGSRRLELTGWNTARLDGYKAQGCFTEIIRYQTAYTKSRLRVSDQS
jgi:hypothetical protein